MRTISSVMVVMLLALAGASTAGAATTTAVVFDSQDSSGGERLFTAAAWDYDGPTDQVQFDLALSGSGAESPQALAALRGADGVYRSPITVRVPAGATYRAAVCARNAWGRACSEDVSLENVGTRDPGGPQEPAPIDVTGDETWEWQHGGHPALVLWRLCVDAAPCLDVPGGAAARALAKMPAMTDGAHVIKTCGAYSAPVEMVCDAGVQVRKKTPEPARVPPTGAGPRKK